MDSGIFDKSAAYWMIPLQIKWGAMVRSTPTTGNSIRRAQTQRWSLAQNQRLPEATTHRPASAPTLFRWVLQDHRLNA
jgi:hypothetical protein